jgi:hypothetical protein
MASKEKWITPNLLILVPGKSGESVLNICKNTSVSGPASGGVVGAYAGWVTWGETMPPPVCIGRTPTNCINPAPGYTNVKLYWQCKDWHVGS